MDVYRSLAYELRIYGSSLFGSVRYGLRSVRYLVRFSSWVWFGSVRFGSVWLGSLQVLNSFGLGHRLTDSPADKADYLERVVDGAKTLHANRWDVSIRVSGILSG